MVEGEKVEFTCSVSKETYEVKWFRDDKEVEPGDKYTVVSEGKRRVLIVKNCELKDEGGYVAHIGSIKASADLCVIGKTPCPPSVSSVLEERLCLNSFVAYFRETENRNSD